MKELLRKVRKLEIKIRRIVDSTFAGEYHSAFKGQGLEFDAVREYQFGDDIRSIDWNVTARSDKVFIKVFREERELTLMVLFDVSASLDYGRKPQSKMETGIELCAVLAFSAMMNNDRFGLLSFTDHPEKYFPPRKGRAHILSIIRQLLMHANKSRQTDLNAAINFIKALQRKRGILIIISDFLDHNFNTDKIIELAERNEVILLRLFHPDEVMSTSSGIMPVKDLESGQVRWVNSTSSYTRQQQQEHFQQLDHQLRKIAKRKRIDYLEINLTRDYVPQLENFFKYRNAGRKMV